jgi:putative membrane protein
MRIARFIKQFNWRFLLVRIVVNAIALAITAIIVPKIDFIDRSIWNLLLMALMLGVLNALLKPILQFLTLQFIFVTYGLVIVLVNTLILWLLSFLFPMRFAVDNLLWALVGGLVLGLLSSFLESLLGLTIPIVPEEETALRRKLGEEARHVDWLAAARHEDAQEEQALAIETPAAEVEAIGPVMAEPAVIETVLTEPATPEPPEAIGAVSLDTTVSADPEPAPEPGKEQEEDQS